MSRPKGKGRSAKPTTVRVQYDPSLKSALVHLPVCLYAPLVDLSVPPQTLVVEITPFGTENSSYYAGWTGMSAAPLSVGSSLAQNGGQSTANTKVSASDVLNLSPSLAASFVPSLKEGDVCSVRLLRSPPLPTAIKIDVTPLSADDWEILSLHAEEIEMNMLGQVRAACTGQVLAVHVGRSGNTLVRFRVDSTQPATSCTNAGSEDESLSENAIAVRLSTDTEVIIAPRIRKGAVDPATHEKHDLTPSKPLVNGSTSEDVRLRQSIPKLLWRVLPSRFGPDVDFTALQHSVAFPPPNATRFIGHEQIQQVFPDGRISVTKVSCPTNNAASEVAASGREQPASSRLNDEPRTPTSVSSAQLPSRPTASARFTDISRSLSPSNTPPRDWPDRHILVGPGLRQQLGIQDYDLVRVSAPPPGVISAKAAAVVRAETGTKVDPTSNTSERAGVDQTMSEIVDTVSSCFEARDLDRTSSIRIGGQSRKPFPGPSCLLVTGAPGSGKTLVARQVASSLAADAALYLSTSYFDCSPYSEERVPVLRARIVEWLNEAAWKGPSLVILDNIDRIFPAEVEHVESQRARQLAEAFVARVRDCVKHFDVFIIATAQSSTSVQSLLNSSHIWINTVQLKPPSKEARREILSHLVKKKTSLSSASTTAESADSEQELNFVTLATLTEGYLPADLRDLVERATHQAAIRAVEQQTPSGEAQDALLAKKNGVLSISMPDFVKAQEGFTPMSLRDVKLEKSTVAWTDIGGLVETRRVLRETLEWPTKYAAIFASCPLRLRSGLLLYGYPGCGKTLLASAVAKECGLNFISVKGPEILNKYIGASEKSVRDLFDRAQAAKPCVLFFDEFDSIAPKRGHDSTGVTDRVVNQMLTQMDGAEGLDGVYVLAATSRPDLIDSALLRPGRLDKSLLCDIPTKDDRLDIMKAIATKVHLEPSVDLESWAERTDGFSGADLQALLYNAHLEAIHETIMNTADDSETKLKGKALAGDGVKFVQLGSTSAKTLSGAERQTLSRKVELVMTQTAVEESKRERKDQSASEQARGGGRAKTWVTEMHLETSLKSTRPSVPKEEQARLRKIYRAFAGDRDGHFPDGQASQEVGARSSLM